MTFRINKTKDYTIMSNYHLRDKRLSFKAKGLLSWMLSLPEDWDYSIAGIVKSNKEGEDAVTSGLNELKKYGYLVVTKLMPESDGDKVIRSRIEYIYNIYEIPERIIYEIPEQIQDTDFQMLECQVLENPRQINTNKQNTKEQIDVMDKPLHSAKPISPKRNFRNRNTLTDDLGGLSDVEEKRERKKNLYEKCVEEIDNIKYNFSDDVKEELKSYLPFITDRSNEKCIKGVNMWKGKLNTLIGLSKDSDKQLAIVRQSINNGWFAFKPLNSNKSNFLQKIDKGLKVTHISKEEFDSLEEVE